MLFSNIEKAITDTISLFILEINEQYPEIHVDHLEEIWNKVKGNEEKKKQTKKKNKKAEKVKETSPPEYKKPEEDNNSDEYKQEYKQPEEPTIKESVCANCIYVFSKGDKKSQICGVKTKDSSYCTKHKKYQDKETVEKVLKPTVKTTEKPREKSVKIVLVKHKTLEKLYHPESNLVFKSNKERIVIGKCVDNIIVKLTDEDIEQCKRWRFNYELEDENELNNLAEEEQFDKMMAEENFEEEN